MATRLALLAALALALIAPSSALADDFWVQAGGTGTTPCKTQATPCSSLADAANAAFATGGDIHVIGPYTDNTGAILGPNVHLHGSGPGAGGTFLDVTGGLALNMLGNATADAVRVRSNTIAVVVPTGAAITGSAIETTSTSASALSVGTGPGTSSATLQGDTITAPTTGTGSAVSISPGVPSTVIQDSHLTGVTGVMTVFGGTGAGLVIQRSTIDASFSGLSLSGIAAFVSSSVVHMTGAGSTGVRIATSFIGSTSAQLIEDTIDGADTTGASTGVSAGAGSFTFPLGSQGTVVDSIVRGFATDLYAQSSVNPIGFPPPPVGQITVARSDVGTRNAEPASTVSPPASSAAGIITDGGGNLNVDPAFANRAGGNYALTPGSPLIDAAGTGPIDTGNNESATDRAGSQRILDGNGDGTAARDMGAFELAFTPPGNTGTATVTPAATPPRPQIVTDTRFPPFSLRLPGGGTLLLFPPDLLKLPVSCGADSPSACVVSIVAQTTGPVVTSSAKRKGGKVLTLGRGHATIKPGRKGTVKVRLSKAAVQLFKKGKLRRIAVVAHVGNAASARQVKKTYKLKAAPKKKKRV